MKKIIIYNMGSLGKFLMGREEGQNAYYVIKRDVFDILQEDEIVKFTFVGQTIINPGYADETIAKFIKEYPEKVFVDKNLGYAIKRVFETLELTNGIKIKYI